MLFDYRKAFDLIDHNLLATKILGLDIPRSCRLSVGLSDSKESSQLPVNCPSGAQSLTECFRGPNLAPGFSYRRIFADVIVYIFAFWHTTYLIAAVAVYMS